MRNAFLFTVSILLLGISGSFAQDQVEFTSKYTNLEDSCLWGEEITGIEPRNDDYRICKGLNGYEVYEYYTTYGSPVKILQNKSIDYEKALAPLKEYSMYAYGKLLEWRFADGEPFAVIYRVNCYSHPGSGENDSELEEYLIVRGLQGYDIEADIDVKKTSGANQTARDAAEKAYLKY
ncbi:MAG: hypothetical protein ACLFQB_10570 [Chitinispirillaceae bacterium]